MNLIVFIRQILGGKTMSAIKTYSGVSKPTQLQQATPQQIQNNAGGYVFEIDDLSYVKRFLILGTEGGNYYVSEKELTFQVSEKLKSIIESRGKEIVDLIIDVSHKGLAPKNDPALYLLALCSNSSDKKVRVHALVNLWRVARIPTHLYHFVTYLKQIRGFGKAVDMALEKWFNNKNPLQLAYSLTKYASRDGFSARDLLRIAKPKSPTEAHNLVYNYVTITEKQIANGKKNLIKENTIYDNEISHKVYSYLRNVDKVKSGSISDQELIFLIKENNFPMEIIPTDKRTKEVYGTVLDSAGLTWIIRNLGNLSKHGLLDEGQWENIDKVTKRLTTESQLKSARIHPINILSALKIYSSGGGYKSESKWNPNNKVIDALNKSFDLSFYYQPSTNKRYYLGLDCSGSMFCTFINGMNYLNASEVGACFAMTILKREHFSLIKGFNNQMQDININPSSSLKEVLNVMEKVKWGATDCSLPVIDAMDKKIPIDVFICITDNETWCGGVHPFEALKDYRKKMGINAKMVVLATSSTKFTIADPSDPYMLDIAGFSSDVPSIISEFSKI